MTSRRAGQHPGDFLVARRRAIGGGWQGRRRKPFEAEQRRKTMLSVF
jgi:hypothetical protein